MSDGLSRIELKTAGYGSKYQDEGEDRGLLRTAPDPAQLDVDENEAAAPGPVNKSYEDADLLPVMIENGLEKIGVL